VSAISIGGVSGGVLGGLALSLLGPIGVVASSIKDAQEKKIDIAFLLAFTEEGFAGMTVVESEDAVDLKALILTTEGEVAAGQVAATDAGAVAWALNADPNMQVIDFEAVVATAEEK